MFSVRLSWRHLGALALLLLTAPFFLIAPGWSAPFLLFIPLIVWLVQRPRSLRAPFDLALVLLIFMVLVSLYATFDIAWSFGKIVGVLLGVAAYSVTKAWGFTSWQNFLWSLGAFGLVAAGIMLVGVASIPWTDKLGLGLSALTARALIPVQWLGRVINPNELAGALLWALPLVSALVWLAIWKPHETRGMLGPRWQPVLKYGGSLFALTLLGSLLLTQSRTAYAACALTVLGVVLLFIPSFWRWVLLLALAVGVVIAWQWAGAAGIFDTTLESSTDILSLSGRVEIWSRALYGLADFPITGMGLNTFRRVVHNLYPLFTIPPDYDIGHAHNEFLQAGLDLGLPGLIAFSTINLLAGWMLWETWRQTVSLGRFERTVLRAFSLGLGSSLFAHLLFGLTDAIALGAKPGILWWMLLGLIAALYEQQKHFSRLRTG